MSKRLDTHPSVIAYMQDKTPPMAAAAPLKAADIRALCLAHGADDAGFVPIDHPALAPQRGDIMRIFPEARTAISFVVRMNREAVRSVERSNANLEFHQSYDELNATSRDIVRAFENQNIPALNASAGFPMEVQRFPGKTWTVAHKPIAEAAGMGRMGLHRNVIHPKFGSFIVLGTILISQDIDKYTQEVDFNPCLECKLCVAACPVDAIGPDWTFNFSACFTHNYREFLGGFDDWVRTLADSENADDYAARVSQGETVSMWQSLSFKPGYKAAYCVAVCPAGEDVIGPFLDNQKDFRRKVMGPLTSVAETVYVLTESDAQSSVTKRFPSKKVSAVDWTIRAGEPYSFLFGLTLTFQRRKAKNLQVAIHLTITDYPGLDAAIHISNQQITVDLGAPKTSDAHLALDWPTLQKLFDSSQPVNTFIASGSVTLEGNATLVEQMRACFPVYKAERK